MEDKTQQTEPKKDDDFPWHLGVYDAHCHPTDTMASIASIQSMKAKALTIMATRLQDQELVAQTADKLTLTKSDAWTSPSSHPSTRRIVPSFGWHPWFSHQMYDESLYSGALALNSTQKIAHYQSVLVPKSEDEQFLLSLPNPQPFSHFIDKTRDYLQRYPVALIGEVGLDRAFRIPEDWLPEHRQERDQGLTPGGREGRRLSPYVVSMEHQRRVLGAQLRLAGELQRAVSVHGVQAHGVLLETLRESWRGHERKILSKKERRKVRSDENTDGKDTKDEEEGPNNNPLPYPPRICLHSYSGPPDTVKMYLHPSTPVKIFFSFSTAINFSTSAAKKTREVIKVVPGENFVVESDLHIAGERMDQHLREIVEIVCELKEWSSDDGIRQLGENWNEFVFGSRP